jgi:4-carboxymuconolactone decarboxylase
MARIQYLDRDDVPESYRDLLDTHLEISLPNIEEYDTVKERNVSGGSRNIYRLFAHEPDVLRSHREHLSLMWAEFDIPPRDRELALLVLGRELRAEYEWHHHVPVAYDEGISLTEIRAIADGDYSGFADHEVALMEYAELFTRRQVDQEAHDRVAATYSDETMLGLSMLLGFYIFLAYTLAALDVDLEEEFVGWKLENL